MLTKPTSHFSILSAFLLVCAGATAAAGCTTETQVVNGSAPAAAGDPALGAPTGDGAEGRGTEDGPLRAVPVSLVTHEGSARSPVVSVDAGFVAGLWSRDSFRLVKRDASGNESDFTSFWTDSSTLRHNYLARDPSAKRIGGYLRHSGIEEVFLYDDSGKLRWRSSLKPGLGVVLGPVAVHGDEVIVSGRADQASDVGCPQVAKGQFIAWFTNGTCRQLSNVIGPHAPTVDYEWTFFDRTLAVAPDGSVAMAGWFKYSLQANGRTHQAVSYAGNSFLAVFEPTGELRWLKTTATQAGDDIGTAAFDPAGNQVMVAGAQKNEGYLGLGEAARTAGSGRAFVVALDAQSGTVSWERRFKSDGSAYIESVDPRGRVLVMVGSCQDAEAGTEMVPAGPAPTGGTCIGALDATTGARRFMKRLGPGLKNAAISADDAGFWLTAGFDGRPDIGFGPMVTGQAFFARYEYR